jgi:4-amino-4-deoxy-L-arabinose transferase-like glycosyltransferase
MAVVSFKHHIIGGYGVETDFYTFVSQAKHVFQGEFPIDGARGPVYFIVLAAVERVFHDFFKSGMVIGIGSAGFFLYLTYRLIAHLFRKDVALFVTVLTALNPTFVQHTYSSGTDMLFAAIAAGAVYYSLRHWPMRHGQIAISGVLSGAAYLTRFSGVFILVGLLCGLILFGGRRLSVMRRVVGPVILCGAFLAAITPWGVYCLEQKGDFFYNTNYMNIAYAVHGEGKLEWDEFWTTRSSEYGSFADVVLSSPGAVLGTLARNVYTHFSKDMGTLLGWQVGVFVIVGLCVTFFRRPNVSQGIYFLLNLLCFAVLLAVFYNQRFSIFLIPVYLLLATRGIFFLGRIITKSARSASAAATAIVLVLVLWTSVQTYRWNRNVIVSGPGEILSLSRWFKANVPEAERGRVIVARKPHIAYYLDLEFKWLPNADNIDDLVAELRDQDADYLYFSYMEASRRPKLAALLDPTSSHPGLRHIVHSRTPPAVLYAVE